MQLMVFSWLDSYYSASYVVFSWLASSFYAAIWCIAGWIAVAMQYMVSSWLDSCYYSLLCRFNLASAKLSKFSLAQTLLATSALLLL